MKTLALATTKSPPCPLKRGGSPQPSVPAVALPETLSALTCSSETLISLTAICTGLLAETLSSDALFLALMRASRDAAKAGVDLEEFNRVSTIILKHWEHQRSRNPMSRVF